MDRNTLYKTNYLFSDLTLKVFLVYLNIVCNPLNNTNYIFSNVTLKVFLVYIIIVRVTVWIDMP